MTTEHVDVQVTHRNPGWTCPRCHAVPPVVHGAVVEAGIPPHTETFISAHCDRCGKEWSFR